MKHRFHVRRCPHLMRNIYPLIMFTENEPWLYRRSIRTYNSILRFPHPKDSDYLYQLHWGVGQCHLWLGQIKQAKRSFLRGMKINPALPQAYLWLAIVYRVEGNHEASASSLNYGLQCESQNFMDIFNYWHCLCDLGWDEEAERVHNFLFDLLEREKKCE